MRPKVMIFASVMILVAGSLWWIARDEPRAFPEAEERAGVGQDRPDGRGDSQPEFSSPKPSATEPSGSRSLRESEAPEMEVARSDPARPDSTRPGGAPAEPRESSRQPRAAKLPDHRPSRDGAESAESAEEGKQDEFGRFKQKLAALRALSEEMARGDPIDADAAGLSPEDVDRVDLDRDRDISSSELETARGLAERAENFPEKNDRGDGEYPVERGEYRREEWEFDAIDTNRDDLIDVDEYHSFLLDTETLVLQLDANGDRRISYDESGLPEGEFMALDVDDSGSLKRWEVRRAVASGALD